MWSTFYRDGGLGMFPTTIDGFLLVASVVLFLLRPERRYLLLAGWLWLATLGSGLLGTSVGIAKSFRAISEVAADKQLTIALLGCAESLNCTILALLFCVGAAFVTAFACLRASKTSTANADK